MEATRLMEIGFAVVVFIVLVTQVMIPLWNDHLAFPWFRTVTARRKLQAAQDAALSEEIKEQRREQAFIDWELWSGDPTALEKPKRKRATRKVASKTPVVSTDAPKRKRAPRKKSPVTK